MKNLQKNLKYALDEFYSGRLASAEKAFTDLITKDPNYTEGWNKRATIRYMLNDLDGSLKDIKTVLELQPRHFGAISGSGMIYFKKKKIWWNVKINFQNEFSKRLITSLILMILLIGMFFIGNVGIYLMVIVLSFFSFLEINNLKDFKIKLQFYIPFLLVIYFLISKSKMLNLSDQFLLICYSLSSLFIIISLFKKSNISFFRLSCFSISVVSFLGSSTSSDPSGILSV